MVVNHHEGVGTETRFFERATSTLNHRTVSSVPQTFHFHIFKFTANNVSKVIVTTMCIIVCVHMYIDCILYIIICNKINGSIAMKSNIK